MAPPRQSHFAPTKRGARRRQRRWSRRLARGRASRCCVAPAAACCSLCGRRRTRGASRRSFSTRRRCSAPPSRHSCGRCARHAATRPIQLQLHLEPSAAADGAGVCAALIAPFEARNCSSQALLVQRSVAHAHTIPFPPPTLRADFALGSWGGANEQSRPKFLLRFAAQPPDDAAVEVRLAACRPRSAARVAARRRRNRLAAAARDGAAHCRLCPLAPRAARRPHTAQHERTAAPRRVRLPFFHSLPAGGSAPVEVWSVAARSR